MDFMKLRPKGRSGGVLENEDKSYNTRMQQRDESPTFLSLESVCKTTIRLHMCSLYRNNNNDDIVFPIKN